MYAEVIYALFIKRASLKKKGIDHLSSIVWETHSKNSPGTIALPSPLYHLFIVLMKSQDRIKMLEILLFLTASIYAQGP